MNNVTQFKLDRDIDLDWYSFKAGIWYALGGDFLCEPSPDELFAYLSEQGIDIHSLAVQFK